MRTVLVVDDDDAVRGAVSEAFRIAGYQVIAVSTTSAALCELDARRAINLAIVDVKMPPGHPHGFALARMARFRQPTLRFVFISGCPEIVDPDVVEYEEPLGPVLLKPVRIAELIEAADAALAAASSSSLNRRSASSIVLSSSRNTTAVRGEACDAARETMSIPRGSEPEVA
jgi:DNA-binding NtrC family response regulator